MKKLMLVIGALIVVLVGVLVAAIFLIDVNRYRGVIQAQLERQLGRKVTLGTMSLGFVPLRVQVQTPVIADDAAFQTQKAFVRADKLDVRVDLSSLLHGNVNVQSLDLERPVVELVQDKRGIWNFSTLGATGATGGGASTKEGGGGGFAIQRLSIREGQVAMTDLRRPQVRSVYDHISLDAQIANRDGVLTINNTKLQIGDIPLSINGSIANNTTPSRLNLTMKTGDVTVSELSRIASSFGFGLAPGTTLAGRVNADLTATGTTASPVITGKIAGRDLKISGKDVPQPIEVKAIDVVVSPTDIRSNDFTARSGSTNVASRFAVRQYASQSPSMDVSLRAPGATLAEMQSLAHAYGMTGLDQMKGAGKMDLDVEASGPLASLNSANVMRAVNGTLNLDFNALRVNGFDVAHELGVIGGFADANSVDQKITDILKLSGHIAVKNGIAQSDDVKAELPLGNLAAIGTADLASEALNMKLSAVLSKAYSDKVGGSRVGGYMRTALANSNGELVVPALVTGTFKQPKFAPDLQAIAELQKQKFIPGYQPGQKPADTIRGILGGFLGGEKK